MFGFSKRGWVLALLLSVSGSTLAGDASKEVTLQRLSLPKGPGTIEGLGESFSPNLATGAASYSVKIEVPKAAGDHTPNVNLSYSSNQPLSSFGVGWSLSTPFVQRQTEKGVPAYSDEDTFISDGEELVQLDNGDFFAKNATDYGRFRKVDDGWIKTLTNGTKLFFGTSAKSRECCRQPNNFQGTFKWHLSRVTDVHGNLIAYEYESLPASPGISILSKIRYGYQNHSSANFHEIEFQYETSAAPSVSFVSRFRRTHGNRCRGILVSTVIAETKTVVRQYALTYKKDSRIPLLSKVTQSDSKGNILPPLAFGYSKTDGDQATLSAIDTVIPSTLDKRDLVICDINHDSLPDVCYSVPGRPWVYHLNEGQFSFGGAENFEGISSRLTLRDPETQLIDITGDGRVDLMTSEPTNGGGTRIAYQQINTSLRKSSAIRQPAVGAKSSFQNSCSFNLNSGGVKVFDVDFNKCIDFTKLLSTSMVIATNEVSDNGVHSWTENKVHFSDSELPSDTLSPTMRLADLNGDRLMDFVDLFDRNGQVSVTCYFGTGDGRFLPAQKFRFAAADRFEDTSEYPTSNLSSFHFSDMNSDGLTDFVNVIPGNVRVWLSRGTFFDEPIDVDGPTYRSAAAIHVEDMNGNGSNDIVCIDPESVDGHQLKIVDCFSSGRGNLLSVINNGLGMLINIRYRPFVDFYVESLRNRTPWQEVSPLPIHVVSEVSRTSSLDIDNDGDLDSEVTNYVYADPYYDGYEKQFRGFGLVTQIDWGDDVLNPDQFDKNHSGTATTVTRRHYHTGRPSAETKLLSYLAGPDEEALKGRLLWEELCGISAVICNNEKTHLRLVTPGQNGMAANSAVYRRMINNWITRRLFTDKAAPAIYNHKVTSPSLLVRDAVRLSEQVQHIEGPNLAKLAGPAAQQHPPRIVQASFEYNEFGGLTRQTEYGVVKPRTSRDAGRVHVNEYAHHGDATKNWILDRVARSTIHNEQGQIVAGKRTLYGDTPESFRTLPLFEIGSRAFEVASHELFIKNAQQGIPVAELENEKHWVIRSNSAYSDRGMIVWALNGLGDGDHPQTGHSRRFKYDGVFRAFPVEESIFVSESKVLKAHASYDLSFGTITCLTDFNGPKQVTLNESVAGQPVAGTTRSVSGHKTTLKYDSHGRLSQLLSPGSKSGFPSEQYIYTIADPASGKQYRYEPSGTLKLTQPRKDAWQVDMGTGNRVLSLTAGLSTVVTLKREIDGKPGTIASATLSDGFARVYGNAEENSDTNHVFVDEKRFDARGAAHGILQPHVGESWKGHSDTRRQLVKHDPLGREIRTSHPPDLNNKGHIAFTSTLHLPLLQRIQDEEDNRTNGKHEGTFTDLQSDGFGQLIKVVENVRLDESGETTPKLNQWTTSYAYDLLGNLVRIEDAQNNVTYHEYDSLNRRREIHDPDRGTWSFKYDLADNLKLQKDDRGATIAYTYDGASRKLTETGQLGSTTETLTFHYDAPNPQLKSNDVDVPPQRNLMGRLAWVEDLAGEEHISYTDRGLREWTLRRITTGQGTVTDYLKSETFDAANRPASQALTSKNQKHSTGFTYHRRGLLADATVENKAVVSLLYHPNEAIRLIGRSNGVKTKYSLDHRLRLERLTTLKDGTAFLDNSYGYDAASNLLRIDDKRIAAARASFGDPNRNTQVFQYDDAYRLSKAKYIPGDDEAQPSLTVDYELDRVGNRLHRHHKGQGPIDPAWQKGAGKQTFAATSNQDGKNASKHPHAPLRADGGASLAYDKSGGVSEYLGKSIVRDPWGHVAEVREGAKLVASYGYDHSGTRTVKRTETDLVKYPFREVRDSQKSGVTNYLFFGSQRLVSFRPGTATHHHHNHIGSVVLSTNVTGRPVAQRSYLAFGAARASWLKDGHRATSYRFAGKELDAETGLFYFEARYHSPVAGVFLSCDPVSFDADHRHISRPIALNPFLYSLGRPSAAIDPTGELPLIIWGQALLASGQRGFVWLSRTPAGRFAGRHADKAARWIGRQSQTAASYLWQHANRIVNRPAIRSRLNNLFGEASKTKLTKGGMQNYLNKAGSKSAKEISVDLRSIGLKLRGQSPDGRFMNFVDKAGNVRAKIHPPDLVTKYPHLHIYDKSGRSLNSALKSVSPKSSGAHIRIGE